MGGMGCRMRSFEISMAYKKTCGVRRNETRGDRDSKSFGGDSIGIVDEQSAGDRLRVEAARPQCLEDRSPPLSRPSWNSQEPSGGGHEIATWFGAGTGIGVSYRYCSIRFGMGGRAERASSKRQALWPRQLRRQG